jgi:Fe-S-cluster containining protein
VVTCGDCVGACCHHLGTPPYTWSADDTPPAWAVAEIDAAMAPDWRDRPYYGEGPCLWLDLETHHCRHYDVRPRVCRDFEPGAESCLEFRDGFGAGRRLISLSLA